MTAHPSSPRVYFPPPFLFVLGFAAGLGLHRLWPLGLLPGGRSAVSVLLAWGLVALGLGLAWWGVWTFYRAKTGIIPHHSASQIVTHGPYRFTRNPMYVGLTAIYLGLAVWTNRLWLVLMLPLVLLVLWAYVIRREERYLHAAFPEDYAAYTARVRRWL